MPTTLTSSAAAGGLVAAEPIHQIAAGGVLERWAVLAAEPALLAGLAAIGAAFAYALWSVGPSKRRLARLGSAALNRNYVETLMLLWALCAACVAAWLVSGRELDALGLSLPALTGPGAWRGWAAWAITLAGVGGLAAQLAALRSAEGRKSLRAQLDGADGYDLLRPRTRRQMGLFQAVAVTAGITEEIIFRGFLIGVLALALPVWIAASAAGVLFVAFHAYQGASGMLRILPITIVLTLIVVLSGSLWPAIALHIAADVIGGALLWAMRDRSGGDQAPRGAVRYPQA